MIPAQSDLHARKALMWAGLLAGLCCAVSPLLVPNGVLFADIAAWFGNGFAVAIYGGCLLLSRRDVKGTVGAIAIVSLGLTHFLWTFAGSLVLHVFASEAYLYAHIKLDNAMGFATTGIVFTSAIAAITRSWFGTALMCAGALLSFVIAAFVNARTVVAIPLNEIGLAAAPLHAGIACSLFVFARKKLRTDEWSIAGRCARCGYHLAGVMTGRCPECGTPIEVPRPLS